MDKLSIKRILIPEATYALIIGTMLFLTSTALIAQTFRDATFLFGNPTNGFEWGTSAADFNNDGWVDIYERGKLYLNQGGISFQDMFAESQLDQGTSTFGAVWGDYDNDGYLDILFENFGPQSRLNRNKRHQRFTYVNQEVNLNIQVLAQTCGWADFNRDGTLDLWVNDDRGDNLMIKNINHSTFQDITMQAGAHTNGNSYGMSWGDFNNDGYPDVFIATCPGGFENHLLVNNGDETFTNIGALAGVNDTYSSWGIIWMDYDNDGFLDVYIANTSGDPNVLYHNNGDSTFTDVSAQAGVSTTGGFGCGAADFDNDGWIDLYAATSGTLHALFRNNHDGTFSNISSQAGIIEAGHDAVAIADYNNDGWMDIFTAGSPQNRLMLNDGGSNHWVVVRTRGDVSNFYGVGARIEVYTGSLRQIKDITAGDSFCSQNDRLNAHFGVGNVTIIDSIRVQWPSGIIDVLTNVPVDQYLTLAEGLGINNPPSAFQLQLPDEGATISGSAVDFRWSPAVDPEGDALQHRLYLWNSSLDTSFSVANQTHLRVDAHFLQTGATYQWMVDVTDRHSIIATTEIRSFVAQPSFEHFIPITNQPVVTDQRYSEGVLWGDVNNDGAPDLFVANILDQTNLLFLNDGLGNFTEIQGDPVTSDPSFSYGGSFGDLDNDGDLDLLVNNGLFNAERDNVYYLNDGAGSFRSGPGLPGGDGGRSWSSSLVDYDQDGWLDVFVANYNQENFLYHNNGHGSFSRVTGNPVVNGISLSLGHSWADVNLDGYPDLFVANGDLSGQSGPQNLFFLNDGNGGFTQVTSGSIATDAANSVAGSWGDYNNDGYPDLFVTNYFGENNRLYRNNGDGSFSSETGAVPANDDGASVGSAWADIDNDGDLDLFVANDNNEANFLYENNGNGTFTRVMTGAIVSDIGRSNGSAWADIDGDGDLDLYVTNGDNTPQDNWLYVNNLFNHNTWLTARLVGSRSNRSAIGARVAVKARLQGQDAWQYRQVSGQTGYNAQNSLEVEFGLSDAPQIDSLIVNWPSGAVQVWENLPVNQFLLLEEDSSLTGLDDEPLSAAPDQFELRQNYPNPFNPSTNVEFGLPRRGLQNADWVTLKVYDLLGRVVKTLVNERRAAGSYTVQWDGKNNSGVPVSSGIYLYRLTSGNHSLTRKMILMR